MPLYSDPGYFYSTGSYSPYYSSNPYASYGTYSRALAGSYVIPTSRTSNIISSSRYKPKLSTISELPYSARGLTTPLTRIQSPRFSYKSPPKYIPPRPIPISTADIDVSASRRPRHEHHTPISLPQAPVYTGPSEQSETNSVDYMPRVDGNDPPFNRSTIKRDRAVVRLSIMHRKSPKQKERPPDTKDASSPSSPKTQTSWRDNFRDELQPKPRDFTRKTPGELLLERHIIRDKTNQESQEPKFDDLSKAVAAESDPIAQMETLRRLSQAQCPTFHDICEDISSDKIDDDLNAGKLRRRASLIQEQEMEILNEIQKSGSDIFQYILERQESQDDCQKSMKRKSKRGRKIRHKITATVAIDESPPPTPTTPSSADSTKAEPPKIIVNLDNVEESSAVQTVVLPKKKKIKKVKTEKTDTPKKEDLSKISDEDVASEDEKTEEKPVKLPKLIIKSDSVVNVTLQINSKPKKAENKKPKETSTPDKDSVEESVQKDEISTVDAEHSIEKILPEALPDKSTPSKDETKKADEVTKNEPNEKTAEKSKDSTKKRKPKSDTNLNKDTNDSNKSRNKFANLKSMFQGGKDDTPTKLKSAKKTPEKLKVSAAEKQEIKNQPFMDKIQTDTQTTDRSADKSRFISNEKQESFESKGSENKRVSEISVNDTPVSDVKKVAPSESLFFAKPKPIARIQKSDSGEDFWGQIGTRETMYMDRRRQNTFEDTWIKRERFLENEDVQNTNDSQSLQKIKDKLGEIKTESLNEAAALQVSKKASVRRSVSDASALEKPNIRVRPQKLAADVSTENSENSNRQIKPDLKVMQSAVKPSDKLQSIEPTTICDKPISCESLAKNEANDAGKSDTSTVNRDEKSAAVDKSIVSKKSENLTSIDSRTKSKEASTIAPSDITNASGTASQSVSDADSALCSGTKIESGPAAKSPEAKIKKQIDKFAKDSNNNIQITTSDPTPIIDNTKDAVAHKSKDSDSKSLATKTKSAKEAKSKITPKKNADRPLKCSALIKSGNVDSAEDANGVAIKEKMAASTNLPTPSPSQSPKESELTIEAIEISTGTKSDGGQHDNDRIRADEIRSGGENKRAPTGPQESSQRSNEQLSASAPTEDIVETRDVTVPLSDTIASDANRGALVADKATPAGEENSTPTNTTTTAPITPASGGADNPTQNASSGSKNRTVAAFNRCLIDVDAELSDYYPSDLENITSDEEVDTSECSSCQGSSMKKKAKHEHRHHNRNKKNDKDAKKFDPNKKIKINPNLKCYVKDEPAPYPLYATPRPLWKREKVNYPSSSDSDDSESDSEYSTSSDECSGDELNPSGVTSLASSDIRMSTCSNDSGFEGGTAPTSPKKMHGAHDTEKPPNHNPAYRIYANHEDDDLETSYTFAQFQRSGRITAPASIIPRFKKYSVEDFHFLAVLGKGSFGKVLLAELRNTDYCYAVKCLKKDVVLEDDDVECTLIERKVLALGTKHPYLCHLFCTFQTESHLFFVMEYLNGGDLMFHIQQSGRFPEPRARFYAAEIISGLKFLHKKGIIYRDLKLDNVLLDFDGHVRIADFGMCKLQIYLDKTADSFCGTPDYMAPEIIKGEKYNQNVDWWSFGVLLYEMLIGQSPFSGCDEDELFWSICNEIPWFPIYITQEATSILKALLQKDPSIRIGSQYSPAGEIYEHVFFREIDWDRLERRAIEPPFKPQVKHPLDTKYFDKTFTRERVRLTPIDKDILQSMDQAQFEGFSYTNPNATLD